MGVLNWLRGKGIPIPPDEVLEERGRQLWSDLEEDWDEIVDAVSFGEEEEPQQEQQHDCVEESAFPGLSITNPFNTNANPFHSIGQAMHQAVENHEKAMGHEPDVTAPNTCPKP